MTAKLGRQIGSQAVKLVFVLWLSANILRTPLGRAMVAIRDSEISAQSMGINLALYKTVAFAVGAGSHMPASASAPKSRPRGVPRQTWSHLYLLATRWPPETESRSKAGCRRSRGRIASALRS